MRSTLTTTPEPVLKFLHRYGYDARAHEMVVRHHDACKQATVVVCNATWSAAIVAAVVVAAVLVAAQSSPLSSSRSSPQSSRSLPQSLLLSPLRNCRCGRCRYAHRCHGRHRYDCRSRRFRRNSAAYRSLTSILASSMLLLGFVIISWLLWCLLCCLHVSLCICIIYVLCIFVTVIVLRFNLDFLCIVSCVLLPTHLCAAPNSPVCCSEIILCLVCLQDPL